MRAYNIALQVDEGNMPRLDECVISIDLALALRATVDAMRLDVPRGDIQFRCPECNYPVKPHKEGEGPDGIDGPHFEHLPGYPKTCSRSHHGPARTAA